MKKWITLFGVLALSVSVVAKESDGADGKQFLHPHLSKGKKFSVCVGASLPSTMQVISNDHYQVTGLGAHMRELADNMKAGAHVTIAAPASFGVVFTDGNKSDEEVMHHIEQVLADVGEDDKSISNGLKGLSEVNRATFVQREDGLKLVTNEKDLRIGEQIWRKLPNSVEKSFYHSEEEYLVAIRNAGLNCEEVKRPCFFGNVKYKAYRLAHQDLGQAYVHNHPFTIYEVTKG